MGKIDFRKRVANQLASQSDVICQQWLGNQFDAQLIKKWNISGLDNFDENWMRESYVHPLFNLLLHWIETGEEKYRLLYLDERLRYMPHQLQKSERAAFFREVLPTDEETISKGFNGDSSSATFIEEQISELHQVLIEEPSTQNVKVLALGDCLMNEIRVFLPYYSRMKGIDVDFRCMYFSAREGRGISVDEALKYINQQPVSIWLQ